MDPASVSNQVKALSDPFRWVRSLYRWIRGRRRVRAFVEGPLHHDQALILHGSFSTSRSDWGNRMFEWEETWHGFGSFETRLTLLVDEGAVEILGVQEKDRSTVRRYRFSPWFYKYLDTSPGVIAHIKARSRSN